MAEHTQANIRIVATDAEDLTVLSSLLQDATVLVGDMGYDEPAGQFLLVAARFVNEGDTPRRRLVGVHIGGVRAASRHGIDLRRRDAVLSLLSITYSGASVDLVFSGGAMVKLDSDGINVYASDLDEGWATAFRPSHEGASEEKES